jgi:hypothetical protein
MIIDVDLVIIMNVASTLCVRPLQELPESPVWQRCISLLQ